MKPALYPDRAPIRLKPSPYLPNAEFKRRQQRVICSLLPDLCHLSEPDDLSPLAPPLPIPNRTVKRRRADDSTDCPCESRSLSGTLQRKRPDHRSGLLPFRACDGFDAALDPPRLDFGDARPQVVGDCGDDDANAIGRVRRERDRALDQVVAADA